MHNSPSWRYDVNFLNGADDWETGEIMEGKIPLGRWGMEERVPKRTPPHIHRKTCGGWVVKTSRDK